ncbi:glycosyltransferase [Flavobacterium solisilvae]|uniref:Glycosyltransferase n=1 Tax=Flavobacterium solisilvae TaxID=1852019 RepID=A0ABX1QU24_9FLAO|nr:glycosyltransferase [Flavobacterium solisilvae]NMH25213.1 glycosyltransferase [Flavobacterium solisilvae]
MIIQSKAYKIAIIGDSLSVGGAERVHARLSEYFVANNHQVFNCIFLDSVTYKNSGELFNLGKIHKNSNPITRKISRFIKLKQFVEKNQFDVIIDFRMRNVFVQEFLISNLIYKKKAIFSVRSGVLNYYFPKSSFLSKLIYKNKKIVAVSSAVKDKIIQEKFAQNVTYIYNPIDFEEIIKLKEEFIPETQNYILAAGRMNNDIKQFDQLIIAYSKSNLPQKAIDLVFLGEGKNQEKYIQLAKNLGLENRVKFLGYQENPFPYYKNAIFTVLSSKNEGFPNVLIESLAVETPVVSFDCFSGPNEIIQHGENGILVDNQDFEKLSQAMNTFIEDTKLYKNCKSNAKLSIKHLETETIGQLWLDLFKK